MVRLNEIFLTLNGLIEICDEGEKGYRAAAERGHEFRPVFLEYSRQRSRFSSELREVADGLGARSVEAERRTANAFRTPERDDTMAVVSACGRGEEATMRAYENALVARLPDPVRRVIELQYRDVREAYRRIRAIEDQNRLIPSDEERTPGTETEGAPD